MDLQDETLDPRGASSNPRIAVPLRPVVQVLFHSDLSRIGDVFELGEGPTVFGRDTPVFASRAPLLDPCVSRRQFSIRFDSRAARFSVTADPSARRPLSFFSPSVEPLARGDELEPGSLVSIGDRLLLRLDRTAEELVLDDLGIVGRSAATSALRRAIRAQADGTHTVLIRGETGVGKELVAQALHRASPRSKAPFVAVNCAALPENLVESELFGHVRGAFSGAATAKDGLFRAAANGTIFLDEIGELPLPVQAKLLRTLQERTVRPLGDSRELPFEAKVVCATHRDLARDVEQGRFRADLYARIEAPEIHVPALREHPSDIPVLFAHFLGTQAPLLVRRATDEQPPVPLELVLQLMRHPWPRNVRELQRWVVALVAATNEAGALRPPPLRTPTVPPDAPPPSSTDSARPPPRGRPDVAELLRVLDAHDYVQHQVARVLGVSRTTLDKWMRELGVRRPKDVPDQEILAAYAAAGGDVEAAARALRVSARGLQLRMTEAGLLKTGR